MHELFSSISRSAVESHPAAPVSLSILMTGLLLGCVACWVVAFGRMRIGLPLVEWERRSAVPWNLFDVACVVFLHLVAIVGGAALFGAVSGLSVESMDGDADISAMQQITMMLFVEVGMLGAVALSIGHLVFRARATSADMGLTTSGFQQDFKIGVLAFLMLITPVLCIQAGLGMLFPNAGQHPFIDLLQEQGDSFTLGMIFVVAVLLAPPIEEFLFRVVIQGWLERFMAVQEMNKNSGLGEALDEPVHVDLVQDDDGQSLCSAPDGENPYAPPTTAAPLNGLSSRSLIKERKPPSGAQSWSPIILSSILFALAHFGQGPAPIPLFFLSMGFGFIYQRTHRIWPSIVAHMLVNGLAVVQLKIALDSGMQM